MKTSDLNRWPHRLAILICLILGPSVALAGPATLTGARLAYSQEGTRLVLELSAPVTHQVFPLEGPDRVVLDLVDTALKVKLPGGAEGDPNLAGLRSGVREGDDLRIVLDLKRPVRVRSALQEKGRGHGHQLILELSPRDPGTAAQPAVAGQASPPQVRGRSRAGRPLVVAIDAGHGGADPGAVGPHGTREKDLTLAVARRLAALVAREPGMRPVLTRDRDVFVPLRTRILRARKHQADIFISIHADAFNNPSARGSSVFTLSRRGASSEAAKWLADKENAADLIGGVDLGESDDQLASVLLDMAQNATLEHSNQAAAAVLKNLSRLGDVHKAEVQKAGFVVLKSPDIPSVLVETAFVSNPDEEARLSKPAYQQQLAEAILGGVKRYFERYRPQRTAHSDPGLPAPEAPSGPGADLSALPGDDAPRGLTGLRSPFGPVAPRPLIARRDGAGPLWR